jgi:hypothetical protein
MSPSSWSNPEKRRRRGGGGPAALSTEGWIKLLHGRAAGWPQSHHSNWGLDDCNSAFGVASVGQRSLMPDRICPFEQF